MGRRRESLSTRAAGIFFEDEINRMDRIDRIKKTRMNEE
jgi:hypothetical protein